MVTYEMVSIFVLKIIVYTQGTNLYSIIGIPMIILCIKEAN